MLTQKPVLRYEALSVTQRDISEFLPENYTIVSPVVARFLMEHSSEMDRFRSITAMFATSDMGNPALRQCFARPSLTATEIGTKPAELNYLLVRSLVEMRNKINSMYWNGLMDAINAPHLFPSQELRNLTSHMGYRSIVTLEEAYNEFHITDLGGEGYQSFESIKEFNYENVEATLSTLTKLLSDSEMDTNLVEYIQNKKLSFNIDAEKNEIEVKLTERNSETAYLFSILTILAMKLHGKDWVQYQVDFRLDAKLEDNQLIGNVEIKGGTLTAKGNAGKTLIDLVSKHLVA